MHGKVKFIISCLVILLAAPMFAGSVEEKAREAKVVQLRQEYGEAKQKVERLIIASKLARAGDYRYWSFVRKEAVKAVQHDSVRLPWYRRWFSSGHVRPHTNLSMNYMLPLAGEAAPHLIREKVADTVDANADSGDANTTLDVNAYTLDVWRILAFSSAAPHEERDLVLLREAVRSPRSLIAAYAALGLARLRDLQSAQTIADAGNRAKDGERVLFIEALVCLNDENATMLARQVAGPNVDVLRALQKLAPRKQYNPFAER